MSGQPKGVQSNYNELGGFGKVCFVSAFWVTVFSTQGQFFPRDIGRTLSGGETN